MIERQIDPTEPKFFAYDFQGHEIYRGDQAVFWDPGHRKLIHLENNTLDEVKAYAAKYYIEACIFLDEPLYTEQGSDVAFTAEMLLEDIREDWDEVNTYE